MGRLLGPARKVVERRSGKAKTGEEAESRVVHERSEPYLTQHHRAQVLFVQSLVNDMRQAGQQGRVESCAWMIMPDLQWFGTC
ncbi:MAG TPA: hypothetical protein DCQ80_06725 [Pseudomonas sp.]|nr:hypothetical protein [Pseudomonas sp.]